MSDFDTVMKNAAEIQKENAEELERLRSENSLFRSALFGLATAKEDYEAGRCGWGRLAQAMGNIAELVQSLKTPDPKGSGT